MALPVIDRFTRYLNRQRKIQITEKEDKRGTLFNICITLIGGGGMGVNKHTFEECASISCLPTVLVTASGKQVRRQKSSTHN